MAKSKINKESEIDADDLPQYDPESQGKLIGRLQTTSSKLSALLDHISGEGFESFSTSSNQFGILWAAQGFAEEISNIADGLLVAKEV